jgi:hypothetical protein
MVPEDLLFWVDTFHTADAHDMGVLCRRHADAMVVPRGWTLDDRREPQPRLFRSSTDSSGPIIRRTRRRSSGVPSLAGERVEQLELDAVATEIGTVSGTETGMTTMGPSHAPEADTDQAGGPSTPWMPDFDADDDLDGLLHVQSPLLARAFRGTDRAR